MKIIAESAFNHNGNLDYLKSLARSAKEAKADYFTVQVMEVDSFCTKEYSKRKIYEENSFSFEQWQEVFLYCEDLSLEVIPCVLDIPSLLFCYEYGFKLLKLHATDITNVAMLEELSALQDVRIILETQCATNLEIKFALNYIGEKIECLMHGFSNYPTEIEDLNLNALEFFKNEYPHYKTGMADHSLDLANIPLMLLAKGCSYLEKHITLSRNNRNFDYQVSLYPHEFASMVSLIRHYQQALGPMVKHPVKSELPYREVMYKKRLSHNEFKRADSGKDYLSFKIDSFKKNAIGIALIARLKSQRLPFKVLEPIEGRPMIDFLYKRLEKVRNLTDLFIATSNLPEDDPLATVASEDGLNVFRGHPVSVIERMLEIALRQQWGGVFRVTGDNPLTDPELMDKMVSLFLQNDLDYVRVNNAPFGVSPELFSTAYLWRLYLQMQNPMDSEYLTLFVLRDSSAKKGCIDIKSRVDNLKYVNLSVDYPEDLSRVKALISNLKGLGKDPITLKLKDYISFLNDIEREDENKIIKLPQGTSTSLFSFLKEIEEQDYIVRKEIAF